MTRQVVKFGGPIDIGWILLPFKTNYIGITSVYRPLQPICHLKDILDHLSIWQLLYSVISIFSRYFVNYHNCMFYCVLFYYSYTMIHNRAHINKNSLRDSGCVTWTVSLTTLTSAWFLKAFYRGKRSLNSILVYIKDFPRHLLSTKIL